MRKHPRVTKEHPLSSLPVDHHELSKQTGRTATPMDPLPPPRDPDQTVPPPWVLQTVLINGMFQGQDHLERALVREHPAHPGPDIENEIQRPQKL